MTKSQMTDEEYARILAERKAARDRKTAGTLPKKGGRPPKKTDGTENNKFEGYTHLPPKIKNQESAIPMKSKQIWRELFMDFISHLRIDSKEIGGNKALADVLYDAQYRFLDEVCEGLERGVRMFVCLKARQLGISTISLAMDLFWLLVHPGLQGALITDTEPNKEKFRVIIERYLESLPKSLKSGIKAHNRNGLVFKNGSTLDYLVAGTKKGGSLGRSRAFNFVHATEVSSYGDEEGVDSLMASLASEYPDRLYIFESTARGFNLFYNMWDKARDDSTQKAFFIGWWAKKIYRIKEGTESFVQYGNYAVTPDEEERLDTTKFRYGVEVDREQLAWYRWWEATRMNSSETMMAEFPWHEQEAFVATGSGFFHNRQVAQEIERINVEDTLFAGFMFMLPNNFLKMEMKPVLRVEDASLKVYEHPKDDACYAIGVDVAFGRNPDNDNSCVEIWRCYADRMVQVAEYATPMPDTRQLAWVLAFLAGSYRNCMINLEVTGPGNAVMQELETLKQQIRLGYFDDKPSSQELFSRIRWYLYHRPDSLGAGYCRGWKTGAESKQVAMSEFRSAFMMRELHVNSLWLLEEMQTIRQKGYHIETEGKGRDDRVMATALAVKAWVDWIRPGMIARKETFEVESDKEKNKGNKTLGFMNMIIKNHFDFMEKERQNEVRKQAWGQYMDAAYYQ